MRTHLVLGCCCLLVCASAGAAAGPPGDGTAGVEALARTIDRIIAAELAARKIEAAPLATDSEFVRRVYLDLAGRIPRVSEVRDFLDDRRPDRRRRLVDRLLAGPNYVHHLTNVWRELLLPQNNNQQNQFLAGQMDAWLRPRIHDNVPYDRLVRELLTAPVADGIASRGLIASPSDRTATAFYRANEMKPDNLAAATSRLFLGVKIECAQCHDHPFAKWTRKQFWEYTAFFAGIRSTNPNQPLFAPAVEDPRVREIALPGSEKKVRARFLDGTEPDWKDNAAARAVLARWMTRPDNPYFARAAANRLWEHFFGIGLVDPVDDFRDDNPPSHPTLLDALAKGLVEHRFDLTFLIRAITASKTYQRTSALTHPTQDDLRSFARVPLKGLSPEQIFDSLATAVGYRGDRTGRQFGVRVAAGSPRGEILARFANPVDRRTEAQTTILQALALMNGRFIADATSLDRSETLAAVLDSPFMDTRQKLDTLFLAALARPMRTREAERLIRHVETGGPSRNPGRALADVFWVLLNSSEFILNH